MKSLFRSLGLLALLGLVSPAAAAADTWTTPFSGGRLLHRVTSSQDLWVLQAELCASGVDVRTTSDALKGRTVSSFAGAVGAVAAVNGDFFSPSFSTDGPAMAGGASWGAGRDHTYVAPISFGPHFVDVPHHNNEVGPPAGATDVVSGHPTLLDDLAVVGNPGDPLCTNRHPRTALGISQDKRTLVLAVVDGRRSGAAGMTCPELAALMAEHGAFDAVNMDGGGSSTMVVSGAVKNRPSDGRERVVGNHLAIVLRDDGATPLCPERAPVGVLDAATCDGGVVGWAIDTDRLTAPVDVHVYVGGPAGSGAPGYSVAAGEHREDLCAFLGCARGFTFPLPARFHDGAARDVFAYAIDAPGASGRQLGNPLLQGAPTPISCAPPPLPRDITTPVRRHVTSPESLAAWRFTFDDVSPQPDSVADDVPVGAPLPAAPTLVRASDDPRVFVRDVSEDDAVLRHIVDLESFAAWRFTIADIAIDDAVVAATRVGPAWPRAPFVLSVGGGPAVSVLDVDVDRPAPGNDDVDNDGAPGDGDDGAPDTDDSGDDTAPTDHDDRAERIIEVVPTSSCAAGAAPDAWLCFALALLARRRRGRRGRPMPRRSCG